MAKKKEEWSPTAFEVKKALAEKHYRDGKCPREIRKMEENLAQLGFMVEELKKQYQEGGKDETVFG